MKKNIVIIHYNTPRLTECLVRSINLFVKDAIIYIFDNSDKDPFIASFDNVTILDNTKGQIINFDKWLEQYPNRTRSGGRANKWGSAKHCYSIEKCMEIIDDNFILLDSDVLLKKDISDLFDDSHIYIAETSLQPCSAINRVLPYMCYINVKMCKENGIHYFDDDYMHGLRKTIEADRYDTGAGFYLAASKYSYKNIRIDDYVIHFGHGSWKKAGVTPQFNAMEWLNIHKNLWSDKKNKNVIYTCITGKYDMLIEPKVVNDGFDYICFTDNPEFTSQVWDIRPIPNEIDNLPQIKKQRYIKLNPHKFLQEYEISLWVDGNVEVKGDIGKLLGNIMSDDCSVYVPKHPVRNCIYSESSAVVSLKKDTKENVEPQMKRYRGEGFPEKYGLLQSNIMIRRHNNEGCIRLMEKWTDELLKGSHRDQLSFNYACWKNQDVKVTYLASKIYESEWFHWGKTHKKYVVPTIHKKVNVDKSAIAKRIETNKKILAELINKHRMNTYNVMIY